VLEKGLSEQKKEGQGEKADIGTAVDRFMKQYSRVLGLDGFTMTKSPYENDIVLSNAATNEGREVFFSDNFALVMRDYASNGLIRTRSLSSYFINPETGAKILHTTSLSHESYGNAIASSTLLFTQLKKFIESGCTNFDSKDGFREEGNGFHVCYDKNHSVYFHNNYIGLSDKDLLVFMPLQPHYVHEEDSLFTKTMKKVIRSDLPETAKHKLAIKIMQNRMTVFEKDYWGKMWSV